MRVLLFHAQELRALRLDALALADVAPDHGGAHDLAAGLAKR